MLGYATVNAPFLGGTLVPDPAFPGLVLPVVTDLNGEVVIQAITPAGLPSGFTFYTQYWIADPGAAGAPFAASNALAGTTP